MNKEEIDKWLNNEYGVSYTRLEELHDFLIEQNMKYQDKIDNLEQENKQLKEDKKKAIELIKDRIEYIEMAELSWVEMPYEDYKEEYDELIEILGDKE